jgi:phosphoglycolate phosphatase
LPKFHVKAVLIDLDGTMIDTAPEIARAVNSMLAEMALPALDQAQIEAYIGEGAAMLIKRSVMQQSATEPDAAALATAQQLFSAYYAEIVTESKPYAGVATGLQALKNAGYRLACVTNKPERFSLPLLDASKLLPYFELVVSGDSLAKKKPDPAQILHSCLQFGLTVKDVVLVGDSKTDIAAARSAGCYVFAVPYGYNQQQPITANSVDAMVNNLHDVLRLIHGSVIENEIIKHDEPA